MVVTHGLANDKHGCWMLPRTGQRAELRYPETQDPPSSSWDVGREGRLLRKCCGWTNFSVYINKKDWFHSKFCHWHDSLCLFFPQSLILKCLCAVVKLSCFPFLSVRRVCSKLPRSVSWFIMLHPVDIYSPDIIKFYYTLNFHVWFMFRHVQVPRLMHMCVCPG